MTAKNETTELKAVIILGTETEIKRKVAAFKRREEYKKACVIPDTCLETLSYWYSKHYGKIGVPLIFTSTTLRLLQIVKIGLPLDKIFDIIITGDKRHSCGMKNHIFEEIGEKMTLRNNRVFNTKTLKCVVCGMTKQTYTARTY